MYNNSYLVFMSFPLLENLYEISQFINALYCWIYWSYTLHILFHSETKITLFNLFLFVVSLAVTLCITRCHSLSLAVPLAVTRCHSLYHSLSFVVTRCHSLYHSLSLVVTRRSIRLSFYKQSGKNVNILRTKKACKVK